ncbi:hypothetical protein ABPG72_006630 [Tetrahymena utriculariae]
MVLLMCHCAQFLALKDSFGFVFLTLYQKNVQNTTQIIDDIDFFPTSKFKGNEDKLQIERLSNSEKIIQSVSNESNLCTQEFLHSLRKNLEKINPLLEMVCFDKMHQENKEPIRFAGINSSKLEEIDYYIKHLIQLENSQKYNLTITQSERFKKIFQIFESKVNFLNENMKIYVKEIKKEFYPFMKKLDTFKVFSQQERFDLLKDLSEEVLQDFIQLLKKKQQLQINNNSSASVSDQIKQQPFRLFQFKKTELDQILSNFPVFDIVSSSKTTDLLKDLDMLKGDLQDGQQRNQIIKNIEFTQEIFINQQQYQGHNKNETTNCISNRVLERQNKYIFRIQLQVNDDKRHGFSIGLMQKSKQSIEAGFQQKLSCQLWYDNKQIEHKIGDGIDKYIKGDRINGFWLNFMLETRIYLAGKMLQVLDYPNYSYQIELKDEFKDKLIQFNDLCLYFYLQKENTKYIIKEAYLIDEFIN